MDRYQTKHPSRSLHQYDIPGCWKINLQGLELGQAYSLYNDISLLFTEATLVYLRPKHPVTRLHLPVLFSSKASRLPNMHTDPIIISSPEDLEQTVISPGTAIQKNYLVTAVELPSSISSSDSETESDNNSNCSTKDLLESIHEEDSSGIEAESTWKSLASTVLDSNRICHDDANSPYCLPADNYEKTRLDMQRKQY